MQGIANRHPRGFAELLFFKGNSEGFLKTVPHPSKSLRKELYYPALKNPIPLLELDTPYDLYTMFTPTTSGVVDNKENLSNGELGVLSECSNELTPLPRRITVGDIILIHFTDKQITKVMLLAKADSYNPHTMKYFKAARKDDYELVILDLNDHKEFQYVWGRNESNNF